MHYHHIGVGGTMQGCAHRIRAVRATGNYLDLLPGLSEYGSRAIVMLRTDCDHHQVDATGRQQSLYAVPEQRAAT